jgi:DNA polymerase-3 subunit alpha
MASLLSSVINNTAKLKEYITECQRIGIRVNQPDINKSYPDFFADNNCVYYSLTAVKSVGRKFAEKICEERKLNGDFLTFIDFVERIDSDDMNRRAVESLIKSGAFDCFGYSRRHMLTVYDRILNDVIVVRRQTAENQLSFFDDEDIPDFNFNYFDNPLDEFEVTNYNLLAIDNLDEPLNVNVKTRYRSIEYPCIIEKKDNNILVKLTKPIKGVTSGQSAVFYIDDIVIGGGIIK